jgi:hypothetical protein
MKLSTILRAIARPVVDVRSDDENLIVTLGGSSGPGFGVVAFWQASLGWPARARTCRIGHLTVAYWGRDTLVHPAPEAS